MATQLLRGIVDALSPKNVFSPTHNTPSSKGHRKTFSFSSIGSADQAVMQTGSTFAIANSPKSTQRTADSEEEKSGSEESGSTAARGSIYEVYHPSAEDFPRIDTQAPTSPTWDAGRYSLPSGSKSTKTFVRGFFVGRGIDKSPSASPAASASRKTLAVNTQRASIIAMSEKQVGMDSGPHASYPGSPPNAMLSGPHAAIHFDRRSSVLDKEIAASKAAYQAAHNDQED